VKTERHRTSGLALEVHLLMRAPKRRMRGL
jgi:hypothetical protein